MPTCQGAIEQVITPLHPDLKLYSLDELLLVINSSRRFVCWHNWPEFCKLLHDNTEFWCVPEFGDEVFHGNGVVNEAQTSLLGSGYLGVWGLCRLQHHCHVFHFFPLTVSTHLFRMLEHVSMNLC